MSKYKFFLSPTDGHIESTMHCEISPDSYQELDFYQFTPVFNSWKIHCVRIANRPGGLIGTNPKGYYHDWFCGWFPENPNSWCAEVFGFFKKHEYSNFLEPPEMKYMVDEAISQLY
jgi:hypothetical protein